MTVRDIVCNNKFRYVAIIATQVITMMIVIANLGASSNNPNNNYSWSNAKSSGSKICGNGYVTFDVTMYFGLLEVKECFTYECGGAQYVCDTKSQSSFWAEGSSNICYKGAITVIVAYTFALLFATAGIVLLIIGNWKKIPFHKSAITSCGIASLALTITAVSSWFSYCHNNLSSAEYESSNGTEAGESEKFTNVLAGYAIALAVFCVFTSFASLMLNIWRCMVENIGDTSPKSPTASSSRSNVYYPSSP